MLGLFLGLIVRMFVLTIKVSIFMCVAMFWMLAVMVALCTKQRPPRLRLPRLI